MAVALFLLGPSGSGKSHLAKAWIREELSRGNPWALMDKDTTGAVFAPAWMSSLGMDPADRDSPQYRYLVRDKEYEACLHIAQEQLALGINVVLPGPWTKELQEGALQSNDVLGFPADTRLVHVWLDVGPDVIRARIEKRADPRDAWKLSNWDEFSPRLACPELPNYVYKMVNLENGQMRMHVLRLLCEGDVQL